MCLCKLQRTCWLWRLEFGMEAELGFNEVAMHLILPLHYTQALLKFSGSCNPCCNFGEAAVLNMKQTENKRSSQLGAEGLKRSILSCVMYSFHCSQVPILHTPHWNQGLRLWSFGKRCLANNHTPSRLLEVDSDMRLYMSLTAGKQHFEVDEHLV